MVLCFAGISLAADTIQAELYDIADWKTGQKLYRIKVYVAVDATSDPAEFNLSTYLAPPQTDLSGKVHREDIWTANCLGGYLVQVDTEPGADPPDTTWDLNLDNDKGADIMALTGLSVTAAEIHDAAVDLGFKPAVFDIQVDVGDIDAESNEVYIYFYILR
jgi:hypothetical protein